MNYAAVNLGVRGFERAQAAYRRAIEIRPNDYDAHLGLAVALRGPITYEPDQSALEAKLAAVSEEIAIAKRIDESRPDAFYNEGIFLYELERMRMQGRPKDTIAVLERAEASFRTFLDKAKGKAGYQDAIAHASEHLQDITLTIRWLYIPPTAPPAAPAATTQPKRTP